MQKLYFPLFVFISSLGNFILAEDAYNNKTHGILHTLTSLTNCAIKEEVLYKLAKQQLKTLNYEKYVLEQCIRDCDESSRKFSGETEEKRALLVASSGIASYRMVYRFTHYLKEVNQLLQQQHIKKYEELMTSNTEWPSNLDLDNTMRAFITIQDVHDIPVNYLEKSLSGGKSAVDLTALQISDIAMFALKSKKFDMAVEWVEWSKKKVKAGDGSIFQKFLNILLSKAAAAHNDALQRSPDTTLGLFEENVVIGQKTRIKRRTLYMQETKGYDDEMSIDSNFWALCAGEKLQSEKELSSLNCYYDTKMHSVWLIGPLKVEQLSPHAIQLHEVLGQRELQHILDNYYKIKEGKIDPELLQNWPEKDFFPELSKKVEFFTGLKLSGVHGSDPFRQVEYVVGRFKHSTSVPHKDPADEENAGYEGNVVATVLFYLNDVEVGGHTAFSLLRTRASPLKGSAVVWYNMHRNGEIMENSWHASCPVLYGHKIAAQKWLRYNAQFQTYKCSLTPNE